MASLLLAGISHAHGGVADGAGHSRREVNRWLAAQPRSVVAEVPFAQADALHSIYDGLYMFNSTWHWQPIVNGYSGFFPRTFFELADHTASFPDERSIEYLKSRGVDLIVIHGRLMDPSGLGR